MSPECEREVLGAHIMGGMLFFIVVSRVVGASLPSCTTPETHGRRSVDIEHVHWERWIPCQSRVRLQFQIAADILPSCLI